MDRNLEMSSFYNNLNRRKIPLVVRYMSQTVHKGQVRQI